MICPKCSNDDGNPITSISYLGHCLVRERKCLECSTMFKTVELGIDQPKPLVQTLVDWAKGRGLLPERLTLHELGQLVTADNHQQGDGAHRRSIDAQS
jgi:hypothetical protein